MPTPLQVPVFPDVTSPVAQPMTNLSSSDRMGRIVAVTGGHAVVLLDTAEGVFSNAPKGPEIGTLLKAETQHATRCAGKCWVSQGYPTCEIRAECAI